MKKVLILACAALTACTNDIDLGPNKEQVETLSNAIGFQMAKKNMTTTKGTETALNVAGHYNFGVWGYKSTDKVNNIMANYLVGYYDATKGYDTQKGTTFGDGSNSLDGKSYWMYEGMGKDEYNGKYAGVDISSKTAYQSNVSKQYLRYWDKAADYTCFYAYAPYINGSETATYVDGTATGGSSDTYTMTIPDGSIKEGYNDASLLEYMYATTTVKKVDYGHDVNLVFKRLNAKVNIGFWEEVPGYKVQIITLKEGTHDDGVYATPAIRSDATPYTYSWGQYYKSNGVKIAFDDPTASPRTITTKLFNGTLSSSTADVRETLKFKQPSGELGTNKAGAKKSDDTYYAIPKGGTSTSFESGVTTNTTAVKTGFTFHVSYKLIGEDTNEEIKVYNATVFVPATFCYWEAGKAYTYYFKITKNSNGSTDPDKTIDPTDPTPDTDKALYPIVFDGCSVENWDAATTYESEHVITDGTFNYYLNLNKTTVSKGASDADRTITVSNAHKVDFSSTSTPAADGDIKVYFDTTEAPISSVAAVTYDSSANAFKIMVQTGAVNGEYSIMYCGVKVATFTVTD